jgi:hypothetical protein
VSTAPAVAGGTLDFVIFGNTPELLRCLSLALGALPEVQLSGADQELAADRRLSGVVIDGPEQSPPPAAAHAERVVVVLDDPVQRAAEGRERGTIGASYLDAVRRLLEAVERERALVLSADELFGPSEGIDDLLEHIGVRAAVDSVALAGLGPPRRAPLPGGKRSLLFAEMRDEIEELEALVGRTFRSWRFGEPTDEPRQAAAPAAAVVYTGRLRRAVTAPGVTVLDDWGVLPVSLGPALDGAASLTVLDPFSFPFDGLHEHDRALPLAVRLPGDMGVRDLIAVFGAPLFEHLGPYDEVSVDDDDVFAELRRRYSWRASARVTAADLAGFASRVVVSPDAPVRDRKARDQVLRSAALAEVGKALAAVTPGERARGIVVTEEIGRWASLLPLGAAGLSGFSSDRLRIEAARADYPEWRFAGGMPIGVEVAHVAVSLQALCDRNHEERERRLRAMFRALRVGGRLVLIVRFLAGQGGHEIGAPRPRQLLEEVAVASRGEAVLSQVRTLRLQGEDLVAIGLLAFVKIGRTERR